MVDDFGLQLKLGWLFCSQSWNPFSKILDLPLIRVAFVLMLLLLCGDIESNPQAWSKGIYKICPSCSKQVLISQVKCNCGYTLKRKIGRPAGTTAEASYNTSAGTQKLQCWYFQQGFYWAIHHTWVTRWHNINLAIGMCYCCGSILWSQVDNSHTSLVDIDLTVEQIPAVGF